MKFEVAFVRSVIREDWFSLNSQDIRAKQASKPKHSPLPATERPKVKPLVWRLVRDEWLADCQNGSYTVFQLDKGWAYTHSEWLAWQSVPGCTEDGSKAACEAHYQKEMEKWIL